MWHNNLGVLLLDLGRPRDALASFDKALALDADNDYAPVNRALALHQLGRTKAATEALVVRRQRRIADAERDLKLAPADPLALEKLARALLAAERDEEAEGVAREALAIEPSPTLHILLASVLEWLERWDDARRVLDAALALDPDHVAALDELAWLAAVTGDVATASDAAARIENLEDERRALYARGYAAVAEGRGADAEAIFDELFARRPAGCCALAWRGIARLAQGRGDAAREDAERVRALVPTRCMSLRHLERLLAS
jgi:tetratricopeptide (TPR) repeat protein